MVNKSDVARRLPIRQALGLVGAVSATKAVQGRIFPAGGLLNATPIVLPRRHIVGPPIIRGFAAPRNAEEKIGRLLIQYEGDR